MTEVREMQDYVKPTMEIVMMMPEECVATNSYWGAPAATTSNPYWGAPAATTSNPYWNGSNVGWWGSPACVANPCSTSTT